MGRFSLGIGAFLLLLAGVSAAVGGQSAPSAAGTPKKMPALPERPPAYLVVDADSGMILGQRDADKVWYPASVTKLMTAYLTFQALKSGRLKLTSPVFETEDALAQPPTKMGYAVGTAMTLDNALKMMIVHSANDIAVAISETVGGSKAQFVSEMNVTARSLGMNSTHYDNPNGLPSPGQLTTARDLAVLARTILHAFPEYRDYFHISAIKAGRRILHSPNRLLERYPGATGMKTGFICDSGYNMVASATRDGRTLIAVVLGARTALRRNELAAKLLSVGFSGGSFGFTQVELASFHSDPVRRPGYQPARCDLRRSPFASRRGGRRRWRHQLSASATGHHRAAGRRLHRRDRSRHDRQPRGPHGHQRRRGAGSAEEQRHGTAAPAAAGPYRCARWLGKTGETFSQGRAEDGPLSSGVIGLLDLHRSCFTPSAPERPRKAS